MTDDLVAVARLLASASPGKPRQAELRRAVSTAYYALFHSLANDAADLLVGTGKSRATRAWRQTYRALDHGFAKSACSQTSNLGFSQAIVTCADTFIDLQQRRHSADYDPQHRLSRSDALAAIALAETAISALQTAPRPDRRAFAIQLLLRHRG